MSGRFLSCHVLQPAGHHFVGVTQPFAQRPADIQQQSHSYPFCKKFFEGVRGERKKIVTDMAKGSMSVPQVAAATELPTDRVLWHIAAMRKYGHLVEAPERDGDYYIYTLVPDTKAGKKGSRRDTDSAAGDRTDEESGEV